MAVFVYVAFCVIVRGGSVWRLRCAHVANTAICFTSLRADLPARCAALAFGLSAEAQGGRTASRAAVGAWEPDIPRDHCVLRRGGHSSGGHSKKRAKHLNTLTIILPLAMTTPTTTTSL